MAKKRASKKKSSSRTRASAKKKAPARKNTKKKASRPSKMVTIVIPTWNEAAVIEQTLKDYVKLKLPYKKEIIVVDDNSKDGTADIVKKVAKKHKEIRLLLRLDASGFGSALVDGAKAAKGEYVVWTMADGCDDLTAVPKMIKHLDTGYDVSVASRNTTQGSRGDQPLMKSICSYGYSMTANILLGLGITDCTNAFRAFKKSILNTITLEANDFSIAPEFAIKAKNAGFKLTQVPVIYKERDEGETKFNVGKMGKKYTALLIKGLFKK